MYNIEKENAQIDVLLRQTAQAQNNALPFDEWRKDILEIATQTPEHEIALISFFDKSQSRKKLRNFTIAAGGAMAAAILIMVSLNMGGRLNLGAKSAQDAAPQEQSAAMPAPMMVLEEDLGNGEIYGLEPVERDETSAGGQDNQIYVTEGASEQTPESEQYYAPETKEIAQSQSRENELEAVYDALGLSKEQAASAYAQYYENASFRVIEPEGSEQIISLERAYVVKTQDESFVINAQNYIVYRGELKE